MLYGVAPHCLSHLTFYTWAAAAQLPRRYRWLLWQETWCIGISSGGQQLQHASTKGSVLKHMQQRRKLAQGPIICQTAVHLCKPDGTYVPVEIRFLFTGDWSGTTSVPGVKVISAHCQQTNDPSGWRRHQAWCGGHFLLSWWHAVLWWGLWQCHCQEMPNTTKTLELSPDRRGIWAWFCWF